MQWLHVLATVSTVYCYPTLPCVTPDVTCDVDCSIKTPDDCTDGHFKPNISECGCCPACIKYLERGESCNQIEIPTVYECGSDLVCSERTGTCVPPSAESPLVEEALFFGAKELRQPNISCTEATQLRPTKPPQCTAHGAYAPKQCRGEVCFCVTVEGKVIPYYRVIKKLADPMKCVCARVEHSRNSGRFCDKFGNYKRQ